MIQTINRAALPRSKRSAWSVIFLVFSLLGSLFWNSTALAAPTAASKQLLILHDASGPYGYLGREYAIMLRNLLGHFENAHVTILPAKSYTPGMIDAHDATFYIGSTYNEASFIPAGSQERINYETFVRDAATTTKTIAWINFNLWELAWAWDPAWGAGSFREKMGYWYYGLKNNSFNRVKYKNTELYKGVVAWVNPGANLTGCFHEGGTAYGCSPELNAIVVTDPAKAQVKATAYSTLNPGAAEEPYITRSNNFWYIGDIPFSYFSEEDRYLAFADILHDIVGIDHQQPLQAMVRLEDVSPGVDPNSLHAVMSYLETENVPFAIAGIPVFKDPNGVLSGGEPTTIAMPRSEVARTIKPFYRKGLVSMVAHGYTHQFGDLNNPYNGLTGDDFEFYRVTMNEDFSLNFLGGVPGDSRQWAKNRMASAKYELLKSGFTAFAWEAPHYFATEVDYLGIRDIYPTHYGRMVYFNNQGPAGRHIGQFFPYVIQSDYYGYRQIPENMGNIEPEPFLGYRPLFPADLIRHAEKMKVVRDGVASFFYHPYLGTDYLKEVIQGLKGMGYEFIAPCSLGNCPSGDGDLLAERLYLLLANIFSTGFSAESVNACNEFLANVIDEDFTVEILMDEGFSVEDIIDEVIPYVGEFLQPRSFNSYHASFYGAQTPQEKEETDAENSSSSGNGGGGGGSTGFGWLLLLPASLLFRRGRIQGRCYVTPTPG